VIAYLLEGDLIVRLDGSVGSAMLAHLIEYLYGSVTGRG